MYAPVSRASRYDVFLWKSPIQRGMNGGLFNCRTSRSRKVPGCQSGQNQDNRLR